MCRGFGFFLGGVGLDFYFFSFMNILFIKDMSMENFIIHKMFFERIPPRCQRYADNSVC